MSEANPEKYAEALELYDQLVATNPKGESQLHR